MVHVLRGPTAQSVGRAATEHYRRFGLDVWRDNRYIYKTFSNLPVVNIMKTHTVKAGDITETWYVVDAADKPLGRLASQISRVLRGKHRPEYSPHLSLGDHVIVVNAERVSLSGNKRQQKLYYRYSGYQSGLKVRTLQEVMERDPSQVVRRAVKGMLPHNRLGRRLLKHLKVYAGPDHPHAAQRPDDFPV